MMNYTNCKQHYGHSNEVSYLYQILNSTRGGTTKKTRKSSVGSKSTATETTTTTISSDTIDQINDADVYNNDNIATDRTINCNGNFHFVLMEGADGTGKRSLVYTTLENWYRDWPDMDVHFISGHFQNKQTTKKYNRNDQPYSAFREAIRTLVDYILRDKDVLSDFQTKVLSSFSTNNDDINILVETFPDLRRLIPSVNGNISGNDSTATDFVQAPLQQKSHMITNILAQVRCPILAQFIYSLSSIIPLVLILEDIQNADSSSIALIKMLILHEKMHNDRNLIVICTYNNEQCFPKTDNLNSLFQLCEEKLLTNTGVSNTCNSERASDDNKDCWKSIVKICINNISWDDVNKWVNDCKGEIKRCTNKQKEDLADFVFHHSNGNPSYVRYLLLYFEHYEALLDGPINEMCMSQNVSDLYDSILTRQSTDVQETVKIVSALVEYGGEHVEISIIETILQQSCSDILVSAHTYGLLEYNPNCPYVRFSRTEFQEFVYTTIPVLERPSFHLHVGRRIWENLSVSTDDDRVTGLLLVASQLHNYVDLLIDFDERYNMSKSCFEAGQKAGFWGDYHAATTLLDFSIRLLRSDAWSNDLYETTLVLYNSAAQAFCCLGDYDSMNQMINTIFDNVNSTQDKMCAYITRAYAHASQNQLMDAFRTETEALHELGEYVDSNPNGLKILISLVQTKWALRGKSDEDILSLPVVENPKDLMLMQLMCYAMLHSYIINPESSILLCLRVLRLTVENGLTGPSAVMLATYGFVLCSTGNFDEGLRYGKLAMKLGDQFISWRPRIYQLTYGYIYYWFYPFTSTVEPLQRGQKEAFQVGDIEIYSSLAFARLIALLNSGHSLIHLKPQVQDVCECVAQCGQKQHLLYAVAIWDYINELMGCNEELNIPGDIKDADSAFRHAVKEGNNYVIGYIYLNRTMWSYLSGDFSQSILMAKKTVEQRRFCDYALTFYEGLAVLAAVWSTNDFFNRRKYKYRGRMICNRIKEWAKRCPANFQNKYLLLHAELCALNGKTDKAIKLFEQSIEEATKQGYTQEIGIAYERLARYEISIHRTINAVKNFEKAQASFQDWGAAPLVHRLEETLTTLKQLK